MKIKAIPDKLSDKNMLDDLQALLDEELAKPLEERDLDAIEEITNAMVSINDEEIPQPVSAEEVLAEVSARKKRHRIVLLRKWAAAIGACCALCVALNFYTLKTYGSNVFEAMINMARSGFSIDTNQLRELEPAEQNTSPMTTTTTAAYATNTSVAMTTTAVAYTSATGNITNAVATTTNAASTTAAPAASTSPMDKVLDNCDDSARYMAEKILTNAERAGTYPCYPTQLPYGFGDMTCTDYHNEKLKDSNDCYFTFENEASKLDITIEEYYSEELMPNVLVPSDSDDYEIFRGKEISGFIMGDTVNCTAVFVYENTVYTLHGSGIHYSELEVIAEGFVPYPPEFMNK